MPLDFDIKKIDYMLKELSKILDNVKQNEGRLRMDYSVSFYNNMTDSYEGRLRMDYSVSFYNNMTDSYNELLRIRKFLQMDSK